MKIVWIGALVFGLSYAQARPVLSRAADGSIKCHVEGYKMFEIQTSTGILRYNTSSYPFEGEKMVGVVVCRHSTLIPHNARPCSEGKSMIIQKEQTRAPQTRTEAIYDFLGYPSREMCSTERICLDGRWLQCPRSTEALPVYLQQLYADCEKTTTNKCRE